MGNVVVPIEQMSDAMLIKHYNARHMPTGGMTKLWEKPGANENLLRAMHTHAHHVGADDNNRRSVNHTHE